MIYVIATLTTKPGAMEALRAPALACIEGTRKEKGCLSYELFTSVTEPEKLVFIESWESPEHLAEHMKQPHLIAWREASILRLVSRKVEIIHPEKVETR